MALNTEAAAAYAAAARKEKNMEHDRPEEELWENLQHPYKHSCAEPLFEEPEEEPEEKEPSLADRVDTMEYRLGRALLCLNQCQKELAELRKGQRELTQEQSTCLIKQERQMKMIRCGIYAVLGLIFVLQVKSLALMGWNLADLTAQLFGVKTELVSGVLVSIALLYLAVKLGRGLIRVLIRYRRKRRGDDAVCDR